MAAKPDLITVGETFEDLVFSSLERMPMPGEEVNTGQLERTVGGGALITAIAAGRLGSRCQVVSALPPAAATLLAHERIAALDLRRIGEPHAVSIGLCTAGERSFVTYTGVNDSLQERLAAQMPRLHGSHLHLAFRVRDCARWVELLSAARARGITSSWDFGFHDELPGLPGFSELLGSLDLLSVNEREAMLLSGESTLPRAARVLAGMTRKLLIKCGPRGARLLGDGLDLRVAAPRVKVIDTVGAGDALNGGFLHSFLRGASPQQALEAGVRLASASVTAPGGLAGLPLQKKLAKSPARRAS